MPLYSKLPRPGSRAILLLGKMPRSNTYTSLTIGNRYGASASLVLAEVLVDSLFHMDTTRNDTAFDGVQFKYTNSDAQLSPSGSQPRLVHEGTVVYGTGYAEQALISLRAQTNLLSHVRNFLAEFIYPVVVGDDSYIQLVQDITGTDQLPRSVAASGEGLINRAMEYGIRVLPYSAVATYASVLPDGLYENIEQLHNQFVEENNSRPVGANTAVPVQRNDGRIFTMTTDASVGDYFINPAQPAQWTEDRVPAQSDPPEVDNYPDDDDEEAA